MGHIGTTNLITRKLDATGSWQHQLVLNGVGHAISRINLVAIPGRRAFV